MVARVATFEGGDNDAIRRMVEENPPQQPDGISKVLVLTNGNERLFITFFDSREAVAAADARFETMGNEISEDIRGRRTSVEVYDVLFEGQPT
jgi:hypothetical protein